MRDFVKNPPARMRDILQSRGVESQKKPSQEMTCYSKIEETLVTS